MTSLSPWRHSPYSHFTDEETEALSSRACLSHSLSEMTQLQKQGAGPHLDVRAPTSPCHRTTWRPCWSPGEGHGPGTTAYSQAGAGRHSACSPWDRCPLRLGRPTCRGGRTKRTRFLGHPAPAGSSPGWAAPAATSLRHRVPQGPGHLPNPSLCPLSMVFTVSGSSASV